MALIISGISIGSVYAVLALGFALVFGVARILNFAHTGFYMITAFAVYIGINFLGIPSILSSILGILFAGIMGVASYKLLFDRIKVHETAVIIVSVALTLLFQEVLLVAFGAIPRGIPPLVRGVADISGARISYHSLLLIGITSAAIGFIWVLLSKTRLGYAIRAVADDNEVANLMGIDVSRICLITVGISAILAGIASVAVVPLISMTPLMWDHPLTMVLAAVILGGLGSVKGSIIGAFVLGFIEVAVVFLIPGGTFLKGAVSLGVMVVVLMVRPEGLFGVLFEEERL